MIFSDVPTDHDIHKSCLVKKVMVAVNHTSTARVRIGKDLSKWYNNMLSEMDEPPNMPPLAELSPKTPAAFIRWFCHVALNGKLLYGKVFAFTTNIPNTILILMESCLHLLKTFPL